MPHKEKGGIAFSVFDRYERRQRDVETGIATLFLNGVSSSKRKGIAKELYCKEISAQTVSNTFSQLDKKLECFKDKPVADMVEFLFLDGINHKL